MSLINQSGDDLHSDILYAHELKEDESEYWWVTQ